MYLIENLNFQSIQKAFTKWPLINAGATRDCNNHSIRLLFLIQTVSRLLFNTTYISWEAHIVKLVDLGVISFASTCFLHYPQYFFSCFLRELQKSQVIVSHQSFEPFTPPWRCPNINIYKAAQPNSWGSIFSLSYRQRRRDEVGQSLVKMLALRKSRGISTTPRPNIQLYFHPLDHDLMLPGEVLYKVVWYVQSIST